MGDHAAASSTASKKRRPHWAAAAAALLIAPLAGATAALAHHSVSVWFVRGEIAEIEGEITRVVWRNPHARFYVRAPAPDGSGETEWDIETISVNGVERWGITQDILPIGAHVRIAGNPSRKNLPNMFARNVLLPDGRELVFGGEPRWSDDAILSYDDLQASEGSPDEPELGLFRVWVTGGTTHILFPQDNDPDFDFETYPLTDAAREYRAGFVRERDDPSLRCEPEGMPVVMESPYPLEFIDEGDAITLKVEVFDTVRTIHMDEDAIPEDAPASRLGYSVGRWEGSELVVTTAKINFGHLDEAGLPISEEAVLTERFSPSEDGARLDYLLTVDDPGTFTAPVSFDKFWIYVPDLEVRPFECFLEDQPATQE